MSEQVLNRFHGALVEALRQRDPEHLGRPFTVAEIYQDLVPYGAYRDVLGVEMNGDYEHALLRLLSGEGDFLEMESEHALREIREELESVNPNTGLYREFAAVDVRLNPAQVPDPAAVEVHVPDDEEQEASEWPSVPEGSPSSLDRDYIQVVPLGAFASSGPLDPEMVDAEPEMMASEPDVADVEPDAAEPEPVISAMDPEFVAPAPTQETEAGSMNVRVRSAPDDCRWCRQTLPKRDNLKFCPFCGTDVALVPCVACGDALEPGWRFCISCGAPAPED